MTPGAKVADAFFLDELGYVLKNGEPIIAKDESLRTSVTDLRIDYIHGEGVLKFCGQLEGREYI